MSRAVRAVTSERGRDPRDFVLVAFGGAGPAYGAEMAREFGIRTLLVPPRPGLFSALGLLVAAIQHHDVVSVRERLDHNPETITLGYREMEERMLAGLAEEGYRPQDVVIERFADARYLGQSSELRISVPPGPLEEAHLSELRERFGSEHEQTYGHRGEGQRVELVNLRIRATCPASGNGMDRLAEFAPAQERGPGGGRSRQAYFGADLGLIDTPVLARPELGRQVRRGPLIVEDMDATTVVPPHALARLDEIGNLLIELEP
jgi:N-methylhydantoinase A